MSKWTFNREPLQTWEIWALAIGVFLIVLAIVNG